MRRGGVALGFVVVIAALALACGSSGRDLRSPGPNAVSPTRSTAVGGSSPLLGTNGTVGTTIPLPPLALGSPTFSSGGTIPAANTCGGPSPELRWFGVPSGTSQLVLAVVDRDDDNTLNWLVTGIPPADGSVAAGKVPAGATQLPNSTGAASWSAPCPPAGETHHYELVLLALPDPVSIASGTSAKDALERLRSAATREASLEATATRR